MELILVVESDSSPFNLSYFDGLEALDATLRPELFKELQAMKLHVYYRQEKRDPEEGPAKSILEAVIKYKLPKLFARDIIEVSARVLPVSTGTTMQFIPIDCSSSPLDGEPRTDPDAALS